MSFFNNTSVSNIKNSIKDQYQPDFPLKYDDIYGPYAPITDMEESLQKNFENLLVTNPGEWPMNPDIGIGLKSYLFENYGSPELSKLKERVQMQLDRYLPSIRLISLEFAAGPEQQQESSITIIIEYSILGNVLARLIAKLGSAQRPVIKTIISAKGSIPVDSRFGKALRSDMINI